MSESGPTPQDALHIAQQALQQVNELQETVKEQQELIEELQAAKPQASEYDSLDREEKAALVKEHVVKKAKDQRGKAAIDYSGIKWEVFSGEPSADHCYTLMKIAAQDDGFKKRNPKEGNKQLAVDIDKTSTEDRFSHANKDNPKGDNKS